MGGVLHARTFHDGVEDVVAIEEPLEVRAGGRAVAVSMRTPGHDGELAIGFLVGEGLLDPSEAVGADPGPPLEDFAGNVVEAGVALTREPPERRFYATSSCGVCGKGALEEVAVALVEDSRAGLQLNVGEELALEALAFRLAERLAG